MVLKWLVLDICFIIFSILFSSDGFMIEFEPLWSQSVLLNMSYMSSEILRDLGSEMNSFLCASFSIIELILIVISYCSFFLQFSSS